MPTEPGQFVWGSPTFADRLAAVQYGFSKLQLPKDHDLFPKAAKGDFWAVWVQTNGLSQSELDDRFKQIQRKYPNIACHSNSGRWYMIGAQKDIITALNDSETSPLSGWCASDVERELATEKKKYAQAQRNAHRK